VLKVLFNVFSRHRQEAVVDGNQERALPQRWRDPAPKPVLRLPFGLRAD
jgi:hypothetical protein